MSEHDKDDEQGKPKIVFAEGCFDSFEGTQEELDAIVSEIQSMFEGKTQEEILAMSVPLENLEEIDDEVMELLPLLTEGNTRQ